MPKYSDKGEGPPPLSSLKRWISEEDYKWIKEGDDNQEALEKELEENAYMNAANLFGEVDSDSDDGGDEALKRRVKTWRSSTVSNDGVGGFHRRSSPQQETKSDDDEEGSIQIAFVLSDCYEGFGDILWSSARYVANTISNPAKCQKLLSPLMDTLTNDDSSHPMAGISFVEVGAGAGVPSWAAMKCGAHVVCTDLSDPNRIRCLAECAQRNFLQIDENQQQLLAHATNTRACPHDWGSPVDKVVRALNDGTNENRLFDVVIAADCCYMPWLHTQLLDSIYNLLSDRGVAIIAFALHGNTDDEDVWRIVDRAKERRFCVELLGSEQLTPPGAQMEAKQGLVHIVRLTKPKA